MANHDPFEPKLGKIGAQKPKMPKSFKSKVLRAASRAGGVKLGHSTAKKANRSAAKFGRGAGVARVLSGSGSTALKSRRVVVKCSHVKLAGKGMKAAVAHLRYLQRDGVTREGEPGELYGPKSDRTSWSEFMERSEGDRHQFRFIVAPEEGNQIEDLKSLTRRLMVQMEDDLGTKLDWVAVDHYNTGHPHTHIVIRGQDDMARDLVIAREYLSEGFRTRAEALVTLDLGPRSQFEILAGRQAEMTVDRFTSIDRHLIREAEDIGLVSASHTDPTNQSLRAGRLKHLETLGLAQDEGEGRWRLRFDMEVTLRQMGRRGDIIKTLAAELKSKNLEHSGPDAIIHDGDPSDQRSGRPVTGRLVSRGLSDEHADRHYVVLEATDGRVHYLDIGQGNRTEPLPAEAIIRAAPLSAELRAVDKTIAEVASANGGYYDVNTHLKFDINARQSFAEAHVRRLEAIRRTTGGVDRLPDGRFRVGADYLDRALEYERRELRLSPLKLDVVSNLTLDEQVKRNGVTWLDQELVSGSGEAYANAGFGKQAGIAILQRQQWLVQEDLATHLPDGQVVLNARLLARLHNREITAVADGVSKETGLTFNPAKPGDLVEGKLRNTVTLGSGKYAVIERSRDFTLVPWKPALEGHIGKSVSGIMRDSGIIWTIGRGRGMEIE